MKTRYPCLGLALAAAAAAAQAADGLSVPTAEAVWPQWQARVTVHTTSLSPLTLSSLLAGNPGAQRGLAGGAVLGDYTFARRSFGSFYASGGLLVGPQGAVPLAGIDSLNSGRASPRLGLAVNNLGALNLTPASEAPVTVPYVGLGFSGAAWRNSLAFTADVGLVAEHANAAGGVGRAIFGSQALDGAVREMRLSPVLQLGVRYTF